MFVSAQWADEAETTIRAEAGDGTVWYVPANESNADYRLIMYGLEATDDSPAISPIAINPPDGPIALPE
jgi:hypothetical protein